MLNYYLYETLFLSFPDFTFYCLLILDLQEICKNVSIPFILFTQLPLMLTSYIIIAQLLKLGN